MRRAEEVKVVSSHVRRRATKCCGAVLLAMFVASSCGDKEERGKGFGTRGTHTIKCDDTVKVDFQNGPKPDSVYLCDNDSLTWKKIGSADRFDIDFGNRVPFPDNIKKFSDENPHAGQAQYGDLDVYKYTIIVYSGASKRQFDPQVVIGGNH